MRKSKPAKVENKNSSQSIFQKEKPLDFTEPLKYFFKRKMQFYKISENDIAELDIKKGTNHEYQIKFDLKTSNNDLINNLKEEKLCINFSEEKGSNCRKIIFGIELTTRNSFDELCRKFYEQIEEKLDALKKENANLSSLNSVKSDLEGLFLSITVLIMLADLNQVTKLESKKWEEEFYQNSHLKDLTCNA